jgi:hypothetical protein
MRRVEHLEVFSMGRVNVGYCGWLVSGGVRVGVGSLEEVYSHQVWEVWVADPMAERR